MRVCEPGSRRRLHLTIDFDEGAASAHVRVVDRFTHGQHRRYARIAIAGELVPLVTGTHRDD